MRKRTRRRLCLPDRACSFWRKRENSAADQRLKCRSGGPKTRVNAQIDFTLFGQFSQGLGPKCRDRIASIINSLKRLGLKGPLKLPESQMAYHKRLSLGPYRPKY